MLPTGTMRLAGNPYIWRLFVPGEVCISVSPCEQVVEKKNALRALT